MTEYPQVLFGVKVRDRNAWQSDPDVQRAIAQADAHLAGRGRLNVRASGTEKLVRVMVEGRISGTRKPSPVNSQRWWKRSSAQANKIVGAGVYTGLLAQGPSNPPNGL